ncbi:MAG: DUF1292 domain-containing protein, partial [Defluviitaleaceae bacterium]|nr:DUF1292 domain-containing protein [Defluviitaleaceae bacterium]
MDYKKKNYIKKYHHKNINEVKELDKDNDKDLNNDLNNEFDGAFDELGDEEEYEIITLLDDDDEEVNFAVLDAKDVNGVTYMLVLEEESLDDDEAEASILKGVMVDGEDEIVY